jgi:hypothetical protein
VDRARVNAQKEIDHATSGFGAGAVGLVALTTANSKASLAFIPALALGIMCNALVCLAVWMCFSARTTVDRVVTIVPPIAAFVAADFEHSIANVYFIPMGLFIKAGAGDTFWNSIGKTAANFVGRRGVGGRSGVAARHRYRGGVRLRTDQVALCRRQQGRGGRRDEHRI